MTKFVLLAYSSCMPATVMTSPLTDCEPRTSSKACNLIKERRECLTSIDDRDEFKDAICGWAFGKPFSSGNRCEPVKWLEGQGLKRDQDFLDCKNGIAIFSNETSIPWH